MINPDISIVAGLIGDSTRASMLTALMGGKALTATELAVDADITAQTASSHLAKLVDGQLLVVRKQGRHKYFQLKNREVAELIEKLLNITSLSSKNINTGPADSRLRKARVCYDHLAGEVAVSLYQTLVKNEYLLDHNEATLLTEKGQLFFAQLGVDFEQQNKKNRPICKSCLDWSERKNHLAGALGQWVLNDILSHQWASKDLDSRAVKFTSQGLQRFIKKYQLETV